MLQSLLNKLFSAKTSPGSPLTADGKPAGPFQPIASSSQSIHYPPQDPGFTCPSAKRMVESQRDITAKIRLHAALTPALFSERFENPIINLANIVGNLPGSAAGVFAGEGGLFRASLEMAYNCLRASDGRIFTGSSTVEERHLLETRWRYVCFAAGMLYPLGAPLQNMQVINVESQRWSPELDSLIEWAGEGKQYWVTWASEANEPGPSSIAGMLVSKLLGRENVAWLNIGSAELIRRLVEVGTGSPAAAPLIAMSVVKDVWASIHERETARLHQNYGRLVVGSHTSPYLIDAMVMLAKDVWKTNTKTLFVDSKGAYLEWPSAGRDIIQFCSERGYRGIPASEGALLTMLISSKIVEGSVDGVAIEEIANQHGEIVGAVKLARPGLLIEDMSVYRNGAVRPVSVSAIAEADPLTPPSPERKRDAPKPASKVPAPTVQRPTLDTLVIENPVAPKDDEDEDEDEDVGKVKSANTNTDVVPASEQKATTESAKLPPVQTAKVTAEFAEGEPISYTALVPKEIAQKLRPHSVEVLGKVINAWRNKSTNEVLMRMTSHGAAIEQSFVFNTSSRGIDVVVDWASQGLLYIDPSRQGVKYHQIATVEGGQQKVACILIANGTAKTLGIS